MNKFQLNIKFIVCTIAAVFVAMGESAMAQRPHDFRSEQIALCARQAACQPGDTVTVQGQVTCLAANRVAPFSNYLYIELINPSDSVVVRQKISCKNKGSFAAALPIDPLAAYGIYYIRAYTNLMRNFAPESFATQPLLVGQSFPDFDKITTEGVKCTILPHGGHLCPGALQNVTAYVTNYLNDPIADVTLALTTQNGDTITWQRTSPSGLAMLSFIPDQQLSYSLQMMVDGDKKVFPMPKCDASKPLLQASVNGTQVRFALLGAVDNLQQLKLYAYDRMNGISSITLNRTNGSFKLAAAPPMVTLFLTDGNGKTLAQCTAVARPTQEPALNLPEIASVGIPIELPAAGDGATVMARLLPINTRWVQPAEAQLCYLADLHSPIPFPEKYLTQPQKQRTADLMAWIGTASFKRFDIAEAVKKDTAIYTYLPDDVMYFRGKVESPSKKPFNNGSLVAYNTESNAVYNAELNKKGEFTIAVDDFDDGTRFFLQAVNKKNKPEAMYVKIDDETFSAPYIDRHLWLGKSQYATSEVTYQGGNWNRQQLPEITVKARTKYDNLHSTTRFYGHSYKDRKTIEERGFLTLFDILKDIPGITIRLVAKSADENGGFDDTITGNKRQEPGGNPSDPKDKRLEIDYAIFSSRGPSTFGNHNQVVMLIDGLRTPEPLASLMQMSSFEIESVEYLRPWQALTYTFGALNGAVNVVTRNREKPRDVKSKGTLYTPTGLTPNATDSAPVADKPGNYRLIVDVISPEGIHSYESAVKVIAR